MKCNKSVDDFIDKHDDWRDLLIGLRAIVNSSGLEETFKWGMPVYTLNGKNVVGLAAFKQHVAIWFYQGALLADKSNNLINAQEGKTQALRHWRFAQGDSIDHELVRAYVTEAIENQRLGKVVKVQQRKAQKIPAELNSALQSDANLMSNFNELAPYKQREYFEFISSAKRAETRLRRLEKSVALILDQKGLNDKYR